MRAQVALCLGVGGIGCSVAMTLCRMGIKKLFILDRDTVDASNLNRQMLFAKSDVGRRKVEAARDTLEKYHNLRTQIVAEHMDAVVNFDKVAVSFTRVCCAFCCVSNLSMLRLSNVISLALRCPLLCCLQKQHQH